MLIKNITIDGNGHTIDGSHQANIFKIPNANTNIIIKNMIFINANGSVGGAINGFSQVINCTFINNTANYGGAIAGSNVYNSSFIDNYAKFSGGAISAGNAYNTTFTNNTAQCGGAIRRGRA